MEILFALDMCSKCAIASSASKVSFVQTQTCETLLSALKGGKPLGNRCFSPATMSIWRLYNDIKTSSERSRGE